MPYSLEQLRSPRAPGGVGVQRGTCLYYPHFSVKDELWAKEALLLWDSIATIIPRSVDLSRIARSDKQFRLLLEDGLLKPWAVELPVRQQAGRLATELIENGKHELLPESAPFSLNFGKVTPELSDRLAERGHVIERRKDDVIVDGRVGALVVMVLAHVLEESTRATPVTDDEDLARGYLDMLRTNGGGTDAHDVVRRDLHLLVPDLAEVELKEWLRFRKRNRAALADYRQEVIALVDSLSQARDPGQASAIIEQHREKLQRDLDGRKGMFGKLTSALRQSAVVVLADLAGIGVVSPTIKGALAGMLSSAGVVAHEFRQDLHRTTFVQKLAGMST